MLGDVNESEEGLEVADEPPETEGETKITVGAVDAKLADESLFWGVEPSAVVGKGVPALLVPVLIRGERGSDCGELTGSDCVD